MSRDSIILFALIYIIIVALTVNDPISAFGALAALGAVVMWLLRSAPAAVSAQRSAVDFTNSEGLTPGPPGDKPVPLNTADPATPAPTAAEPAEPYGRYFAEWSAYKHPMTCLGKPIAMYDPAELDRSVDSTAANYSRQRARDKRCIDGAVVKTADYYAFHYGNEFDAEERKRWWGNNEW